MLTMRLIRRWRVSTWDTLHILETTQLGLPVISEKKGSFINMFDVWQLSPIRNQRHIFVIVIFTDVHLKKEAEIVLISCEFLYTYYCKGC